MRDIQGITIKPISHSENCLNYLSKPIAKINI